MKIDKDIAKPKRCIAVNINKVVIKFLQGRAVTQIKLGGHTITSLVQISCCVRLQEIAEID